MKPPLSEAETKLRIEELSQLRVVIVDVPTILSAVTLHFRHKLNFYDALQVEAARTGGAEILYSEDTNHGQNYDGVRVINPFL